MGEGYPTYTLDGCWGVRAAGVVAATGDRVCPDEPSCDVRSAEAKSNSKDDNAQAQIKIISFSLICTRLPGECSQNDSPLRLMLLELRLRGSPFRSVD